MADIVLPGISSLSAPGVYTLLQFGQGQSGLPTQQYSCIILANGTSSGSVIPGLVAGQVFGPDTLTPCQTVSQAVSLFGAGSPAALMFAAFKNRNVTTPLYVAPVAAASGTAASQSVTLTASGSPNQTSGVVQYRVDGKTPAQAVFGATDSATTIAAALAASINANVNLPVTATSSSAVLTVTAKVAGARGNNLLGFAQVVAGSGVTVSVTSPARFTSGAGSDAANYTSVLNALALNSQRYYYYIPEAGADNIDGYTNGIAAEVQSQIDTMAQPAIGLRQRAVFGSNDTVAHTTSVSTILNDARCEIVQCNKLDLSAGELAATWAASISLFETEPLTAQSVNFDSFGGDPGSQPFWQVAAPLDGSAPSSTDIQNCIVSGITPLRVVQGGNTVVVKRVTSRWFSVVGSSDVLDLTITDAGKVTVADRFFDDLSSLIGLRFPRMLIGNDTSSGAPPAGPGVATVSKVKNTCLEVIGIYNSSGLINGVNTAAGLVVQRNVSNSSSIGIVVPLFTSDLLHQVLVQGAQQATSVIVL